jgi:hypothetical protein
MNDVVCYLVDANGLLTPDGYVPPVVRQDPDFQSGHFQNLQDVLAATKTQLLLTEYLASLCKDVMGSLPQGWEDEPEAIVRNWFLVVGGEQEKMVIQKANDWLGENSGHTIESDEFAVDDGGTAVAHAYFLHNTSAAELLNIEMITEDNAGLSIQKAILKCPIGEANELAGQHDLPLKFKFHKK